MKFFKNDIFSQGKFFLQIFDWEDTTVDEARFARKVAQRKAEKRLAAASADKKKEEGETAEKKM